MTKKFHLIYYSNSKTGEVNKTTKYFQNACVKHGVEFVGHDVTKNGTTFSLSNLPVLGTDDMLYRSATGKLALTAERLMSNEHCTTFYRKWQSVNRARIASWFTHRVYNLPVVPSYPGIPASKEELEQVVEQLDSFPIVIKVMGGSLGVGVMRIDSMKSLQSILDYLASKQANVMLRKYIPHEYYVRAVVVGDEVVASKAAFVRDGEFRTNTLRSEKRKREEKILPIDTQKEVVQAVHVLGIEAGGVDLLFDDDEQPFIAEVNFPNDFTTTQKVTGVDIAGKMVEYLLEKAERKDK